MQLHGNYMSESASGEASSDSGDSGKGFSCPKCDREFETDHGVKQHKRVAHTETEPTNRLRDFDWLWQQRWVEGRSEDDIATELDCTRPAVGYWLKKYGIGGRIHPWAKDAEILHDLYIRRDHGMAELADMLNVDRTTLSKYATEFDCNKDVHRNGSGLKWAISTIKRDYRDGKTIKEIADAFDCSRYGIIRVMELWGVDRRKPGNLSGKDHPMWNGGKVLYYGPGWYTQRNKARERDNYVCQRCGVEESELPMQLDVHHKTPREHYVNQEGDVDYEEMNRLENLITLCRSCHKTMEYWPVQPE